MKLLSIAIVTQIESPTISENLKPVLEARGYKVYTYDISSLFLDSFVNNPILEKLLQHDLVYYRTGVGPEVAILLESYLKSNGVVCVNLNYSKHPFMAAKTYQVLSVAEADIMIPKTLHDRKSTFEEIAGKIGSPFVAKANRSSQGSDVHLINNQADLDVITPELKVLEYFFQEFIPHKSDYRVHVVGNTATAMYQRIPADGDFRSNIKRGGSMQSVETEYKNNLSVQAVEVAQRFGFAITAVDFMRHSETGEFYFTEINLNPGWQNTNITVTGVDFSGLVADFFEELCA